MRIGQGEEEIFNSSGNSAPPGFRQMDKGVHNSNIMKSLLLDCCSVRSGSELNNWISTVVRQVALEIGVSSNNGRDAVEIFFFELGMRHLKAKMVVDRTEDE
ncbi:hypothetical protein FRX31_022440 [Thalictrum thalictroides]|uniref:Uncharacterized protein n=1 Tax=Thalictrum thalictroides TaxID=46969 RepID=A0A7J6VSA3_THATH|nr:hypothetical protein FRX31_022440 [Thalictrum thalictroides]